METFQILYLSFLSVSLLGVIIQILINLINKLYKSMLYQLLLCFFINCMCLTGVYMMNYLPQKVADEDDTQQSQDPDVTILCPIQSYLMIFFEIGQFLWGAAITNSMYNNVIDYSKRNQEKKNKRSKIAYYVLNFTIPVIFVICVAALNFGGPAGHYCWIKSNKSKDIPSIVLISIYIGIIWMIILYNSILVYKIVRFIREQFEFDEEGRRIISEYKKGLICYPITCVIVVGPASVYRLVTYFLDIHSQEVLDIFTLIVCLQGLFYSIGYGLNTHIKSVIIPTLKAIFCCDYQKEEEDPVSQINSPREHGDTTTTNMNMNTIYRDSFLTEQFSYKEEDGYSLSSQKVIDITKEP